MWMRSHPIRVSVGALLQRYPNLGLGKR